MPKPVDDSKMWDSFVEDRKTVVEQHETKILEAYKNGQVSKEQLIEEGLWDRIKARGAGAIGNISSAKDKLGARWDKSRAQKQTDFNAANKRYKEAAKTSGNRRAMSIINSHVKKIQQAANNMWNDLGTLGLSKKDEATGQLTISPEFQQSNPEAARVLASFAGTVTTLSEMLNKEGHVGKAANGVGSYQGYSAQDQQDQQVQQ
jgi:hypothetical protein